MHTHKLSKKHATVTCILQPGTFSRSFQYLKLKPLKCESSSGQIPRFGQKDHNPFNDRKFHVGEKLLILKPLWVHFVSKPITKCMCSCRCSSLPGTSKVLDVSPRSRDGVSTCAQCRYYVLLKEYILTEKDRKYHPPLLTHSPLQSCLSIA